MQNSFACCASFTRADKARGEGWQLEGCTPWWCRELCCMGPLCLPPFSAGTIVYMPKELLLQGRMTMATDIYSFGLMSECQLAPGWALLTAWLLVAVDTHQSRVYC